MKQTARGTKLAAIFIAVLGVITIVYSCRKANETNLPNDYSSISVASAKNFFIGIVEKEKQILSAPYSVLSKGSDIRRFARMQRLNRILDWDKAELYKSDEIHFLVVAVKENKKILKNKHFEGIRALIFYKDRGGIQQFTIIEALSKKDFEISSETQQIAKTAFLNMLLSQNKRIAHENLSISFYDMDYILQSSFSVTDGLFSKSKFKMLNTGKVFINEKIKTNSIDGSISSPLSTKAKINTCQVCTDYATIGIWYDLQTGQVVSTEIIDQWTECIETDTQGQITYETIVPWGNDPLPTFSKADHKLPTQKRLPKDGTNNTQVGQTCVFKVMEYLSRYFDGSLTTGEALLWLAIHLNLTGLEMIDIINTNGVTIAMLIDLAENYFDWDYMSGYNGIKNAIDLGHPGMGWLDQGGGVGHMVMLTGYNDNGTIEYFDPQSGLYQNTLPSNIQNPFEIKNKK